jgi:MinD-like ATPase involved in chromosome partitioning or flagellar assembly
MLAQAMAEELGHRGQRVLLIMGSGKYDASFLGDGGKHSLDDLKASVLSGKVTAEDLQQVLLEEKHMTVLPGVRNPLSAKYFPENTYEVLLAQVREEFDYIIVDGGEDANLGLMISALNTCEDRFLVTTQQSKSIHRLNLLQKNVLEPLQLQGTLIINKYLMDPALFLKKDVLRFCAMAEGLVVPYSEYGWQAEMEGRTLLFYHKFARAIGEMADRYVPAPEKEGIWKKRFR